MPSCPTWWIALLKLRSDLNWPRIKLRSEDVENDKQQGKAVCVELSVGFTEEQKQE